MASLTPNLRKAAVLLRALDGETAATMLAQLSPEETAALRSALRHLGPIDVDEQADVVAEFRRVRPLAVQAAGDGVELSFSSTNKYVDHSGVADRAAAAVPPRFEFLEHAPINALAPYLAREHSQTIALVLSHLRPQRAAAVLAALPAKRQAEVLERLNQLGDTDPVSVAVVEHELAAWLKHRDGGNSIFHRRRGAVASILAAADTNTRNGIIANLKTHKAPLAEEFRGMLAVPETSHGSRRPARTKPHNASPVPISAMHSVPAPRPAVAVQSFTEAARVEFDQLTQLDDRTLAAVLSDVDPRVLVLALAGSTEDFVDRICDQMPKRVARTFRRQLRRLGPTRLSDVEAAQCAVAAAAAQRMADRRSPRAVAVNK